MRMITLMTAVASSLMLIATAGLAATVTEEFDTPLTAKWQPYYPEAPTLVASEVPFDGDQRLEMTTTSDQTAGYKGIIRDSSFAGVKSVSADFWLSKANVQEFIVFELGVTAENGTSIPNAPAVSLSLGKVQGWRLFGGWNVYDPASYPNAIVGDQWLTLGIELDETNDLINYLLDGTIVGSVDAFGTTSFSEVKLQVYKQFEAPTEVYYIDNLRESDGSLAYQTPVDDTAAVPLPAGLLLFLTGLAPFGLVGYRKRQRTQSAQ